MSVSEDGDIVRARDQIAGVKLMGIIGGPEFLGSPWAIVGQSFWVMKFESRTLN
jgi:hypothetical protein